jgi:hypothetical protein
MSLCKLASYGSSPSPHGPTRHPVVVMEWSYPIGAWLSLCSLSVKRKLVGPKSWPSRSGHGHLSHVSIVHPKSSVFLSFGRRCRFHGWRVDSLGVRNRPWAWDESPSNKSQSLSRSCHLNRHNVWVRTIVVVEATSKCRLDQFDPKLPVPM